jgi:hypothetical protein
VKQDADMDLTKWEYIYLDTNILSYLANHSGCWSKLSEYLFAEELFIAVSGAQLVELVDADCQHEALRNLLLLVPSAWVKPIEQIVDEEVAAYPNPRTSPLMMYITQAMLLEKGDPFAKLKGYLGNGRLKAARRDQKHSIPQFIHGVVARKSNFPPSASGKYVKEQAGFFAWCIVLQWLASSHLSFVKQFKNNASELRAELFPSIYVYALYIYYKYYLQGREPKRSDFGDLHHIGSIPYCRIAVVEKDMCSILNQIKRNENVMPNTEVHNIDFIRNLCD